jgi:hypothetical protein
MHPIFKEGLDQLDQQYAEIKSEIEKAFTTRQITNPDAPKPYYDDETAHAAASLFVIEKCLESDDQMIEVNIGRGYLRESIRNVALRDFLRLFVRPLAIYLKELLSDQAFILTFLNRYKQKCEWFRREELFALWETEHPHRKGEEVLKKHLFEYMHDQGFGIFQETESASGKIDLIATLADQKVYMEAKVFYECNSNGKQRILNGFKQAYLYFQDHNTPVGYLVIYKTCDGDLRLKLSDDNKDRAYLNVNNITVYIEVIDIFPYEESASARGRLQPIEITSSDLVQVVKE